jgi:hypothetical protein
MKTARYFCSILSELKFSRLILMKSPKFQIRQISVRCEPCWYMRTDSQMDKQTNFPPPSPERTYCQLQPKSSACHIMNCGHHGKAFSVIALPILRFPCHGPSMHFGPWTDLRGSLIFASVKASFQGFMQSFQFHTFINVFIHIFYT